MGYYDIAALKDLFLLDREVVFLNHGSFGATPRAVFQEYQRWQHKLERQPVRFLARELPGHLERAREALAAYLQVDVDDLVYVPNATFGVNIVARSIPLGLGDQVLASDHEYGACDNVWNFVCQKAGARYVRQPIQLPVKSSEEIGEEFWRGVTPDTKVIFLSHITSPTAIRFPVEEICHRAREVGILTIIDGAHALGQIPVDLEAIGADFYTGNCHKWMMAPKGSAFLHVRRERQAQVEPLVVSWGWGEHSNLHKTAFLDAFEWWGTIDPAACLSVPAAIQFQAEHDWSAVGKECQELVRQAHLSLCDLIGLPPLYPPDAGLYYQMATVLLPAGLDPAVLQRRLYEAFQIEIPCFEWNERGILRISVQGYNSQADIDALINALSRLLPQMI